MLSSIVVLCFLVVQVQFSQQVPAPQTSVQKLADANNKFFFDLYKQLVTNNKDGNVFCSPLSISTALAMAYYGAKGRTAEEMRQVLGYNSVSLSDSEVTDGYRNLLNLLNSAPDEYTLNVANAALVDDKFPIREEYKEGISAIYKALIKKVNFGSPSSALREVNFWVKEKTRGKISELLKELDPLTVVILLNAVYFKGIWQTQFDKENTFIGPFYNDGIETSRNSVETMFVTSKFRYAEMKQNNFSILELPYRGQDISMLVLLPDNMNGLPDLEQSLTNNLLKESMSKLKNTTVAVKFPKFKLDYKASLKEVLQGLGMPTAFSHFADFSGISQVEGLEISNVVHKAVVEVNEEGSEAAASTAVIIITRSGSTIPIPTFWVNHPFLFLIMDNRNDMILFAGRVTKLPR